MKRLAIAATLPLALAAACSAEDLIFEPAPYVPSTAVSSCSFDTLPWFDPPYSWQPYIDTNSSRPLDELSSLDLENLCVWINQGTDPCNSPAPVSGYSIGQSAACSPDGGVDGGGALTMVWLGVSECVENLMHSDCAALVADLVSCVEFFGVNAANPSCTGAMVACQAYESDPGCNETVVQANPLKNGLGCANALPLLGGLQCAPADDDAEGDASEALDAGVRPPDAALPLRDAALPLPDAAILDAEADAEALDAPGGDAI